MESAHFKEATAKLPAYLSATPDIVNVKVDGWSKLWELAVDPARDGRHLQAYERLINDEKQSDTTIGPC